MGVTLGAVPYRHPGFCKKKKGGTEKERKRKERAEKKVKKKERKRKNVERERKERKRKSEQRPSFPREQRFKRIQEVCQLLRGAKQQRKALPVHSAAQLLFILSPSMYCT